MTEVNADRQRDDHINTRVDAYMVAVWGARAPHASIIGVCVYTPRCEAAQIHLNQQRTRQ